MFSFHSPKGAGTYSHKPQFPHSSIRPTQILIPFLIANGTKTPPSLMSFGEVKSILPFPEESGEQTFPVLLKKKKVLAADRIARNANSSATWGHNRGWVCQSLATQAMPTLSLVRSWPDGDKTAWLHCLSRKICCRSPNHWSLNSKLHRKRYVLHQKWVQFLILTSCHVSSSFNSVPQEKCDSSS